MKNAKSVNFYWVVVGGKYDPEIVIVLFELSLLLGF